MDRQPSITPWDLECMLCDEMAEPKALPLSLLEEITYGFSNEQEIGRGGFAVVYKGKLENMNAAVKRMSNTYMYEKEFQREVECLMMVKHKNVVRFLGYCADTQGSMEKYNGKFVMADVQQRLLCFEYLPKGSLHEYITDTSRKLRWRELYQIIMGICQGLHYLHQKNILHLDLKPANILLDENLIPKITDFGISRCFDQMKSQVITNIAGTPGYLAPESYNHTEVTYRNSYQLDIYSLGVVIVEILTGNKGYHDVEKVVQNWSQMLEESQSELQLEQVRVCIEIGVQCTNFDPAKRPNTQHIISRFEETEIMYEYAKTSITTSQQINPDTLNGAAHAFWLSYQQLGPDIRRCLEYCCIFPKGSKLRMVDLIRLWIAQGFVKTSCAAVDLEGVAEGYAQELVSCSFLQQEETGCFTIDDVLHDLLDKVAGNFFRIENAWSHGGEGWEGDIPRDVKHLFVQKYDARLFTEQILGLKNLHTLIIYVVEDNAYFDKKVIDGICKWLTKLRVLAIAFSKEHDPIKRPNVFMIPESIRDLKNLCYLALRTTRSCEIILPSTLNKLQHIQLLDFGDGTMWVFTLADLITLRHIICGSNVECPSNLCRLISLQTIPNVRVSNEQGYELRQLRNLNKLRGELFISGLEHVKSKEDALEANLTAKKQVTNLSLLWAFGVSRCNPEVEAQVFEGLCPPVGLVKLVISTYQGSRYPDWMVRKQNSGPKDLQRLELWGCSKLESASELAEAFPHLRVLGLFHCTWNALPDDMEHLTALIEMDIEYCKILQSLPTLPGSLQRFGLRVCNDEFMKTCETVGHPNWEKIKHIPNKEFFYGR